MEKILIDTSAWKALIDSGEISHAVVKKTFNQLKSKMIRGRRCRLYVTDYLFSETMTLVRLKIGHAQAVRLGEMIKGSQAVTMTDVNESDREEAWRLFKTYSDHELSFVDCTSFVVMKRLSIDTAFTLDRDFQAAGFTVLP